MPTAGNSISIIIPCYQSQNHIKRCLDSILASTFRDFEILIADDGSTDQSKKILDAYRAESRAKLFFFAENQGPARLRNFLGREASGKYLFFLDIDTRVEEDCLGEIFGKLETDPSLAGLQTALLQENGRLESAGHFLSPFGFPYEIGVNQPPENHPEESPIFGGRTAALAVRKEFFEKAGGFDEDYLIYGEDTDFCWRIWLAGGRLIYFPTARVWHFQKSSFGPQTSFRLFYEGAKTGPANLLKNASWPLTVWMLPLNLLGWQVLGFKLLFRGRMADFLWIWRGLFWNLKNSGKTLAKRRKWPKNPGLEKIISGPLSLSEIIKKGLNWSKNV